jgi:predicted metalloprotease
MRFDEGADLDTSGIEDARGGGFGGRGLAFGGGGLGVVGVVIYLLVQVLGGGGGTTTGTQGGGTQTGTFGQLGQGRSVDDGTVAQDCRTGHDANTSEECAVVAEVDSIQDYWSTKLGSRYTPAKTVFFSGSVQTGCGAADSGVGPFYCPADKLVYIDLSFFDELRTRFGAEGGTFVDAYVLAHEYGHHVQDLLGTSDQVQAGVTGPASGSVRLELQADCYAGVWADHATTTPDPRTGRPLVTDITQDDVSRALDTAGRIGDDFIQRNLGGGQVDASRFTHGTSAERQRWFTTGLQTGDPAQCDTFGTNDLG